MLATIRIIAARPALSAGAAGNPQHRSLMKRFLPSRPGRLCALLGLFLVSTVLGWSESRVWVQYEPGAKGAVMSVLKSANGRIHYEFDNINAVAVSLPEQALAGLSRNPNVALVEEDPIRVMSAETVPYGVEMVFAPEAIAAGATGSGIIVGVIDSGVFAAHEDFAGLALAGEPGGDPDTTQTAWNRDRDSHGTHVVGTIAAANNTKGVVGVAPGVGGIYMVKVFGDTGNWVYSSTLLAAVQRAVASNGGKAKIVSMSLGGGAKSRTEENGLKQIYNSGVLLIAAAGNAGNGSTSYPAGYSSVMSVAAVDSSEAHATFSQTNSTVEISAPGVGVLSTVSYRNAALSVGGTSYIASAMEFAGQANVSGALVDGGRAPSPGSWAGKVVLVERGDNSFADKVSNVQAGGGVAAIIYNNVDGGFSGTLGSAGSWIPAISVTRADGQDLLTKVGQTASVSTVASIDVSGYDYFDGTSMATPHVSGVAALIWSKYASATNQQVRQALNDTAKDLGSPGRDNTFGNGLVQASAALTRLGQIVGGGNPPPTGDTAPPEIGDITGAPAKGKAGTFAISFTTSEPATCLVIVDGVGQATTPLGTDHSVKVRGTLGDTYSGTVTATDAARNVSAPKDWDYINN